MKVYKQPGQTEPVFLIEEIDTRVMLAKSEYGDWPATLRHLLDDEPVGEPEAYNRTINAAFALLGKEIFEKGQDSDTKSGWDLSDEGKNDTKVGGGFF